MSRKCRPAFISPLLLERFGKLTLFKKRQPRIKIIIILLCGSLFSSGCGMFLGVALIKGKVKNQKVFLHSNPEGARVYLDQSPIGTTPCEVDLINMKTANLYFSKGECFPVLYRIVPKTEFGLSKILLFDHVLPSNVSVELPPFESGGRQWLEELQKLTEAINLDYETTKKAVVIKQPLFTTQWDQQDPRMDEIREKLSILSFIKPGTEGKEFAASLLRHYPIVKTRKIFAWAGQNEFERNQLAKEGLNRQILFQAELRKLYGVYFEDKWSPDFDNYTYSDYSLYLGAIALSKMTGADLGKDLEKWREWWKQKFGHRATASEGVDLTAKKV